ncbi:MAG: dipeptide epimerase [bacterium]
MKVHYQIREMHPVVPFRISRETKTIVRNLFLELDEGIGESSPCPYFGDTLDTRFGEMADVISQLGDDPFEIEEIMRRVSRITTSRVLRAAVDIALHDLIGKRLNKPLYSLFGLSRKRAPQSTFTIGIDKTETMVEQAVKATKQFPLLKIKLGGPDDLNVMQKMRDALPKQIFRVDANGGWHDAKEALKYIDALAELKIEFVEQPLPPTAAEDLKKVFQKSKLPIILDESVRESADVPKVIGQCHGINIKLMKCGGIREALRTIHTARAHGLQIMLGCMLESSVAVTAAAHISPLVDYADLDGAILLADDPFVGMKLEHGWIRLPDTPGLGVQTRSSHNQTGVKSDVKVVER